MNLPFACLISNSQFLKIFCFPLKVSPSKCSKKFLNKKFNRIKQKLKIKKRNLTINIKINLNNFEFFFLY